MGKIWLSYLFTIFLIGIFIIFFVWFFSPYLFSPKNFYSPLPDFLQLAKNAQVATINLFLPKINTNTVSLDSPAISAKAFLVYDLTEEKMIFGKDINQRLPIASLTKVMTAIVALEHKREDDKYLVVKEDLVGENSMGLTEGEVLSLEELLYGLILVSANDASEVLARNTFEDRKMFVEAMNDKAESLGLANTHFTNPSGLQGDGNQYSTAYDLLVITNYALSNFPLFREIAAAPFYNIAQTSIHKEYYLDNETNLLKTYPGVKGVKTGYTPEADLCLITYLVYQSHRFIAIILGSNNRRDEMKELLDYSLLKVGVTPPPHS